MSKIRFIALFALIVSAASNYTHYRDEKWPESLPGDQYAAQVRQNCSDLFDKVKKLLKKDTLSEQDQEKMAYFIKIIEAAKCTDRELLTPDNTLAPHTLVGKALQQHDEHDKNGWVLADRHASNRRLFCSYIFWRPILIAGKSDVKEFAQEVAQESKKLSDTNLSDEERKEIEGKQSLLEAHHNVLNQELGSYNPDAALTEEEKAKIDRYLEMYELGKCTDRELFRSFKYE